MPYTTVVDDVTDNLATYHNELANGLTAADINTAALLNCPTGYMINGRISVAAASSDLAVSLKALSGSDAASDDFVQVRFGNTMRKVSSALSVSLPAGTNYGNAGGSELATKEVDWFVYLGYNATDGVVLGVSRIPYATVYSDFSASAADYNYAKISTTTNAAAGDEYVNIGRFAATLSGGAGYTWTVPTYTPTNLIQRPVYESRLLDYVPQFTNLTVGSGTLVGKYQISGKVVRRHVEWEYGAGSAVSGSVSYTFPFTPNATLYANTYANGVARLYDTSASTSYAAVSYLNAGKALVVAQNASATYLTVSTLSSTVPFTWATGDTLSDAGVYYV